MPSRLNSSPLNVGFNADVTIRRLLSSYRLGLLAGGIVWVLVASTLCGCRGVNGWVMNQSGRQYYKQGNYVAAQYEFERAMMDQPYKASYAYNAARAMEKQGNSSGAGDLYAHALTINPSHKPSYSALSTMLNNEGRTDDARNLLAAWSHSQPYSPAANLESAQLERMNGNMGGAEMQLQAALNKRPAYVPARRELRSLLSETGRPYEASNLMLYKQLSNNPYNQSMAATVDPATGAHPSAAQHIASYMPQVDPNMPSGIVQASFNRPSYGGQPGGMQMESSPMMAPQMMNDIPEGWTPVDQGQPQPMMAPGQMQPTQGQPVPMQESQMQGMPMPVMPMQGHPMMVPNGSPMPHAGMTMSPQPTMAPQMMQPQMAQPHMMQQQVMQPQGMPMNHPPGMPMQMQGQMPHGQMMQGQVMQGPVVQGPVMQGQMMPPQGMQMAPQQGMQMRSTMMGPQNMQPQHMSTQPMAVPSPYPMTNGHAPQMMPTPAQPQMLQPQPTAPISGASVPVIQAF